MSETKIRRFYQSHLREYNCTVYAYEDVRTVSIIQIIAGISHDDILIGPSNGMLISRVSMC